MFRKHRESSTKLFHISEKIKRKRFRNYVSKKMEFYVKILQSNRKVYVCILSFRLQAKLYKMTEICKHNLTHYKNQIPSLKAQIEKLHKRIDEKEIRYNSNIMKNNRFYVKLWELQKNNILGCIKKVKLTTVFILKLILS